jgi:hypothetical protein
VIVEILSTVTIIDGVAGFVGLDCVPTAKNTPK